MNWFDCLESILIQGNQKIGKPRLEKYNSCWKNLNIPSFYSDQFPIPARHHEGSTAVSRQLLPTTGYYEFRKLVETRLA